MAERQTVKNDVIEALSTARKMLEAPEPLTPVRLIQLNGLLAFAEQQVTAHLVVARPRKGVPS